MRDLHDDSPDNPCFGCGPHNPRGLGVRAKQTGPNTVECRYTAHADYSGPEGVVHGGIQATLLDEAMGFAVQATFDHYVEIVTAEFSLRYRRPVPVERPLVLRAEVVRREGRNLFVEAELLDDAGEVATTASARWVYLG